MDISQYRPAKGFWVFCWKLLRENWKTLLGIIFTVEAVIGILLFLAALSGGGAYAAAVWEAVVAHQMFVVLPAILLFALFMLVLAHKQYESKELELQDANMWLKQIEEHKQRVHSTVEKLRNRAEVLRGIEIATSPGIVVQKALSLAREDLEIEQRQILTILDTAIHNGEWSGAPDGWQVITRGDSPPQTNWMKLSVLLTASYPGEICPWEELYDVKKKQGGHVRMQISLENFGRIKQQALDVIRLVTREIEHSAD